MKRKKIDYTNWSKDEVIKELKRIKEITYGLVWHRDVPQEKIDVLINPDARTPAEMFANEVSGKPFPVLKEIKNKEVISNKNDQTHILIEGDNYHSLAVLNFTHQEAIDVIYIDPPYNTGNNDFIYTDKYKSDYVIKDDPFRHSKWLSFMEKRLKLAYYLLKPTGVMFISIDDNEQAPLKLLCDEIFGEKNFITNIIWQSKTGASDASTIDTTTEYVLVYVKSGEGKRKFAKNKFSYDKKRYRFSDDYKKIRGKYYSDNLDRGGLRYSDSLNYPIKCPDGIITYPNGRTSFVNDGWTWKWGKEKFKWGIANGYIEFKKSKNKNSGWAVYYKNYMFADNEGNKIERSAPQKNLITDLKTGDGAKVIKNLFGFQVFKYSKPVEFVKRIINYIDLEDGATILDFMAGSGTTGHAVLDLNKENDGNKKFILCTNNESNICTDICQPRLQKAIKGYNNSKGEKIKGLGGNLKYYTAYDFVESEPSDKNKHKLVNKCTEMLCIKEGTFDLVKEVEDYKIFKNNDNKYVGIIFYEDAIDEYKKAIKKIDNKINTYVFSLGDDPHTTQFGDVKGKVILQAIPEIILKVYKEIFR